ncbi:eukaryotic translation initiation factor 3 subunit K, putative [Plasmodium berghei]|uniref:Eukaryotic translation initiation factor 3 subunit K n=2 Tax=Plasmodium berghei TaxID=5821 RepID=A0A509AD73_PLABA|nr:eukaryotic translation initiation factor 3 subunit K, putative [Plasmodium berghei ANKA]CXI01682.1 eukaryotic translation initiation factor 3 subunit K, putative [Plasmodium berghei]SCL91865.1 eukaryotic translation initiation factor 3 subunit K, putative [Plasmodium berghei]SCM15545.1 eukaryotic translation initiation factor 3 subunit K, putative [Plasmodium berghei]SCM17337.1 eukaryotic translation initiation factor 3 subunit K, putative [Plasmodium berghei]SCN22559.1 eukaryotic translati|eukprot:XP_034420143.1 eukaryotic translation initiation factor 3 subunit K, putative [Plasmodium berghei ANKA]
MNINSIIEEVQAIKVYPHMMFNASKLKVLSDYVDIAFENNEYFDNEVMLTLLRLFCLYPHCYDKSVIKKILVCVLYNINTVDMNIYLSLINPNIYDDNIKGIVYLHDLIKECQFKKLWNCINNKSEENNNYDYSFLQNYNNFTCNIRKYILNSITLSFEKISIKQISEYLNMENVEEIEKFLNENKWTVKKIKNKDGEEQTICINENIENIQNRKNISTYFNDDNLTSYINKLNS